jgi:hypothetical protein
MSYVGNQAGFSVSLQGQQLLGCTAARDDGQSTAAAVMAGLFDVCRQTFNVVGHHMLAVAVALRH